MTPSITVWGDHYYLWAGELPALPVTKQAIKILAEKYRFRICLSERYGSERRRRYEMTPKQAA